MSGLSSRILALETYMRCSARLPYDADEWAYVTRLSDFMSQGDHCVSALDIYIGRGHTMPRTQEDWDIVRGMANFICGGAAPLQDSNPSKVTLTGNAFLSSGDGALTFTQASSPTTQFQEPQAT